ncbi:hypothetical protein ACFXA0_17765 [Streptomyces cyaneofuscatus]|uniref:hypothetical protein n=1 Tax=Streptomyces TaxID=1883 RepID=UPI00136D0CCE|nr:hypothetical protein [Streptomyces sp. SID2119]MYW31260.1 hypothetical protein [Streptomyces sp. SID2119]
MDVAWYIAGRALPLDALTGHRPPPDERADEREVCLRIARGQEVDSDDLDIAYSAAAGAVGRGVRLTGSLELPRWAHLAGWQPGRNPGHLLRYAR